MWRRREGLSAKGRVRLKELLAVNETLNTAYVLKEDLRGIFDIRDSKTARAEFRACKQRARESNIPEILEYVKRLDRRRFGILNFFKHRKTNGLSEGFNNVVKTIKKAAYGFHDWRYFRLKILRKCGTLSEAIGSGLKPYFIVENHIIWRRPTKIGAFASRGGEDPPPSSSHPPLLGGGVLKGAVTLWRNL